MGKLGMSSSQFSSELPLIFFIIHYFIDSVQKDPQGVYDSLNKIASNDVEKYSDDNVIKNLYNYQTSNFNENEEALNSHKNNMMDERKYYENYEEEEVSKKEEIDNMNNNVNDKIKNTFEKLNENDMGNAARRSYEFEDVI